MSSTRTLQATLQPWAVWEEVTITFNSTANADTVVPHTLAAVDPEAVNYIPVRKSKATDVYHDVTASRKKWQRDYIVLRSSVGGVTIKLLLYISNS